MRHRIKIKHFNRDTKSRKALLRNSLRGLIEHASITTTESRAKEVRRLADKLIAKAKKADLASRRQLHRFFGKRDVVNTLVDKIAPAMGDKKSGFTSLEKLSHRRGDNSEMFKLSLLVDKKDWQGLNKTKEEKKEVKTEKKAAPKKKAVSKKADSKAKSTKTKKEESAKKKAK